jgi:hypothetical protein
MCAGKTLMLVLQGLRWLREGLDVDIISTELVTYAVALMIERQLKITIKNDPKSEDAPKPGKVRLHRFVFTNSFINQLQDKVVEQAAAEVANGARHGKLCLLMDESGFGYRYA